MNQEAVQVPNNDFELKEKLSDYYLDIFHKCGRVSQPSFSSLKVGMTRRVKQTGIRHEKNIFFETKENLRLKILVFLELLSGSGRNYTAPLVPHLFSLFSFYIFLYM